MQTEADALGIPFSQMVADVGLIQFNPPLFVHPIAAVADATTLYLIDNGRLLAIPHQAPHAPTVLLAPGDTVETLPVQELLDVTISRAGCLSSIGLGMCTGMIWPPSAGRSIGTAVS
jgi:hypothetical protein